MKQTSTVREAKDFLAQRIATEAKREGSPLTEIERKMLYFSETDWTLPDMAAVSAEFDRAYDQDEYEQKIAGLVRKTTENGHSGNQEEMEAWDEAVVKLTEGDNYLTVLIGCADRIANSTEPHGHGFLPVIGQRGPRSPHDRLKLWISALVGAIGFLGIMIGWNWLYMNSAHRFQSIFDWLLEDRDHTAFIVPLVVVAFVLAVKAKQIAILFFNRK